jgi:hypothetical protein
MEYVSAEEFDATVAAMEARQQAARAKRFAGKRERTYKCYVVTAKPLAEGGACEMGWRKIRGYTFADAKEQAGIR